MKKLILFLLAVLPVMGIFAQNVTKPQIDKLSYTLETIKTAPAKQLTTEIITNKIIPYEKTIAATDTAFYLKPEGSFYGGVFAKGGNTYPLINVPAGKTMKYKNVSSKNAVSTWSVNGTAVKATSTNDYETSYGFGQYILPTLTTTKGSSYTYGSIYSNNSVVASGYSFALPMTNCTMFTSPTYNSNGNDCYMVDAGPYGKYAFGTDLIINNKSLDTLGVIFNNISTMYVDTVVLPIYNSNTSSVMIPNGATLKLTAYKVNPTEKGFEMTNIVLATATATANNITFERSDKQLKMLAFVFKSTNALGISTPKPAIFNGPFYLQLTGYNESNCDFGILSDYFSPTNGSTYFVYKGGYSQIWQRAGNIAMTLNAILPAMIPDTTDINYSIPVEGGTAVNNSNYFPGVFSTFAPANGLGEWSLDGMPEWLTVKYNESYFTDYSYIGLEFNADALPAGVAGRSATITITSLGQSVKYNISQGTVNTGVEDTKISGVKVSKTSNAFEITKADNYKSVSLMNVSGQLINSYPVTNGFVSVPTSDLVGGVYLLRLNGNGSETIKVIK